MSSDQVTLEQRMYNLITAVHLAESYRDSNFMPRMDGNSIVMIHSIALDYQAAGGLKYRLDHNDTHEPVLVITDAGAEY
jgi:hypothetical protein